MKATNDDMEWARAKLRALLLACLRAEAKLLLDQARVIERQR